MIRPGLLGFVGIPLKGGSGGFIAWGTPRFGGEATFCWAASIGVLGSFRLYHRRAVEARLPPQVDPLKSVRPGLLGFVSVSLKWVEGTCVGDWIKEFCLVPHSLRLLTRSPAFSLGGEKASAKRDLFRGTPRWTLASLANARLLIIGGTM